jgi:acetoin utilization protein AcuC
VTDPGPTVVWDDRFYEYDFGADHPFTERSRGLAVRLLEWLAERPNAPPVTWVRDVDPAERALLATFHEEEYLDLVERASRLGTRMPLDAGDTPSFPGCYESSARIVGGAYAALAAVREHHLPAFHPGGGLHHAHPGRASGFCIFNDVALVVGKAVRDGLRVAYIDIDAHHGDGVMYGFYDSGRVLDIDFHQDGRTLFPGTGFPNESGSGDGAGLKVNVPLPPLAGDEAILPLFRRLVPPLLESFRPEVIVLQHGVDGHAGDALARLQYTPTAYEEIVRTLLAYARERSHGRLLVTGGGGYRPESVSRVLARAGALLAGLELPLGGSRLPEEWRYEFFRTVDESAPGHWTGPDARVPSEWRHEDEATLVLELEEELGRSFPSPGTG